MTVAISSTTSSTMSIAGAGGIPVDPVARFEEAVRRHPDRIAVRDRTEALTFAQLDRRTARLAGLLAAHRGGRVGVGLGRGATQLVALLAVWRAGAAYVPLDPKYPRERLEFMAADAGLRIVLAQAGFPELPARIAVLDPQRALSDLDAPDEDRRAGSAPAARPAHPALLDPAYVIYTSGTTGRPKGVEATRVGVAGLLSALEEAGIYDPEPRVVGWNASMSFDASVQQWARVCRGDTIVVLDDESRTDADRLRSLLDTAGVQDLDLTPSHWELIRGCLPQRPVRLFMGGEPVPPATWRELAEASAGGRLSAVNLYGPTECTVDATAAWITGDSPHIGRELPGTAAYVLDQQLRPLAEPGGLGELYLSGRGLALGYLDRPGLTSARFVADPFGPPGTRMYRTGDLVRRRPGGELDYAGRSDTQVKLRGYRIELSEIEAVLGRHPGVATAVVAVHRDTSAGERLVAYFTRAAASATGSGFQPAQDAESVDAESGALRAHCAAALPEIMVPAVYLCLDAIPLTVNGKVDRDRLPEPPAERPGAGDDPEGVVEELIASAWSEVLGRDRVGADDDFFALGGHSLLALRVVGRLKRELGVVLPTAEVYRHPRLRDLAAYVEVNHASALIEPDAAAVVDATGHVPISEGVA